MTKHPTWMVMGSRVGAPLSGRAALCLVAAAAIWVGAFDGQSVEEPDTTRSVEPGRAATPDAILAAASGAVDVQALVCSPELACFSRGYRDFGGNPEWEEHFANDVIPCESKGHGWEDTYSFHISRAQFHPGSWATAVDATQLDDPSDPYHVGAAVAAWSSSIDDPGGIGGWPACWWEGDVP